MPDDCYCGRAKPDPDLPPGYCARCDTCGAPGHLRHFPGAAPFTGGWCDRHYRLAKWVAPQGTFGALAWPAAGAALLAAGVSWRSDLFAGYLLAFPLAFILQWLLHAWLQRRRPTVPAPKQ